MGDLWETAPSEVGGSWVAYRQVGGSRGGSSFPPLYHSSSEQQSGRWHRRGEGHAQYLALEAQGAWAELLKQGAVRDYAKARRYTRQLWQVHVHETKVADLSTFQKYVDCGLDPLFAIGEHAESQKLADALRGCGYRGVLSPSAALSYAVNLTLFGPRLEWVCETQPPVLPAASSRLPVIHISDGHPPASVLTRVSYEPADHIEFEEFMANDSPFDPTRSTA